MVSPVNPNEVRLTGENSFIRLGNKEAGPLTTVASHWRILFSPAGPGHLLSLYSELTNGQIRVYSDNKEMARWMQEEIEGVIAPGFADPSLPVTEAVFSKHGDIRSFWTEKVASDDMEISLTWYDFAEPFFVGLAPGNLPGRPHGSYSVLIPAGRAQLLANGKVAQGQAFPRELFGQKYSNCCVAWSETWVRPH